MIRLLTLRPKDLNGMLDETMQISGKVLFDRTGGKGRRICIAHSLGVCFFHVMRRASSV